MIYEAERHPRARFGGHWIWPILLVASLGGCAAMEGVNVGANIPIGGIVSVGANKTIGSQGPAPSQKKPAEKSDDSATTEGK